MTFACQAHEAKCVKYNSTYKVEHHREMAWCCKANLKTNFPKLKEKKANLACILSSVLSVRGNIKLIEIIVCFGNLASTKNGMLRNINSSKKKGANQFA